IVTTYEDALKTNETLYVPPGYVSVVWCAHRLDPVCGVAFSTNAAWPCGAPSTWTLARPTLSEARNSTQADVSGGARLLVKAPAPATRAQAIVATAARAAPISVRM